MLSPLPMETHAAREYCLAVARKFVRSDSEANDIAQDAMLLAHRHRASFRGQSKYSTWLYRIAATTALMHLRKQRRSPLGQRAEPTSEQMLPQLVAPQSSAADRCEAAEQARLAARTLDAMGAKYREVFELRYVEGATEAEICDTLGLPLTTVKTRAHRARVAVCSAIRRSEGFAA